MSGRRLGLGAALVSVAIAAGLIVLVFLAATAKCPAGQHEVLDHYQPIVTIVNKVPIVTEVPIYRCSR